jgi:hypothetical protein
LLPEEQSELLALLERQVGTLSVADLPPDVIAGLAEAARKVHARVPPPDPFSPPLLAHLDTAALARLVELMEATGARGVEVPDDPNQFPRGAA